MFSKVLAWGAALSVAVPVVWLLVERERGRAELATILRDLRARNENLDFAALWPPPVPVASNGLMMAMASVGRVSGGARWGIPVMGLCGEGKAVPGTRLDWWVNGNASNTWDQVSEWIAQHSTELDALQEALEMPYRRPVLDLSAGYSRLRLHHFGPVKQMVGVLGLSALEASRRGDIDGAESDLRAMLVVVNDLEREPLLISQLVRMGCASILQRHLWAVLHSRSWDAEALARLQSVAESSAPAVTSMLRSLEGERAGALLELLGSTGSDPSEIFSSHDGGLGAGATSTTLEMPETVDDAVGMAVPFLERFLDWARTRVLFPIWQFGWGDQAIAQYLAGMGLLLEDGRTAKSAGDLMRGERTPLVALINPETPYRRLRSFYAAALIPALERAVGRAFRLETDRSLLMAEIAVHRYRTRHGRWPDRLEVLVPEFLSALPVDGMDGKPVRYRPTEDGGFVLWSVGEDGVDDGGVTQLPQSPWHGRSYSPWLRGKDAVWPRPASDRELADWVEEETKVWAREVPKPRATAPQ